MAIVNSKAPTKIKFELGKELQKSVEYDKKTQMEQERLALRRERRIRTAKWCSLSLLVLSTILLVVFREQTSTYVSKVCATLGIADKQGEERDAGVEDQVGAAKRDESLPFVGDVKRAKKLIGGAKAVNEKRERLLEDLKSDKPVAPENP